jgi:hypothetical protein
MTKPTREVVALAAALSLAVLAGCPSASSAPPPPSGLTLSWSGFDELVVLWTPPSQPVDGYVAEGRVGSGPFEAISGSIPGNAIGGHVTIDAGTPELVVIGIRLRSVRGGQLSAYTPEATIVRGLRAPSTLVAHTQREDVALSWTRGSTAAESVVVERAIWDVVRQQLGPYETVATLPGGATSHLDTTTPTPNSAFGYRVSYAATLQGAPVRSDAVEKMADSLTTLSPPSGLQATLDAGAVRLSWTPTSRFGVAQQVERSDATADSFTTLATLDAAATTYLDAAPPAGGYRYRVLVLASPGLGAAGSDDALSFVPPAPGRWGLQQEVLHVPAGDGVARGADGSWWFSRTWTGISPPGAIVLGVWTPTATGWDPHPFQGSIGGDRLAEPGVLLDPAGRPHVLWLLNLQGGTTSPRLQLRHAWNDGSAWNEEVVAERVFSSDNLGYRVYAAIDGAGALYATWEATQIVGSTLVILREYATNAGSAWTIADLPLTLVDSGRALSFRLAVSPDGVAHVVVVGWIQAASAPGVEHLWHVPGGAWQEELVAAGPVSFSAVVRLVAHGADDIDLVSCDIAPPECRFVARTVAGWGSPDVLGTAFVGSGFLLPSLAVSPDRQRRAALVELADGLDLVTWEPGTGWTVARVHATVPFDVPWLGFDAQGVLHALLPGGSPGADGFADRIHLSSTR